MNSEDHDDHWDVLSHSITPEALTESQKEEYAKVIKSKAFSQCTALIINLLSAYKRLNLRGSACPRTKKNQEEDKIESIKRPLIQEIGTLSKDEAVLWLAWRDLEAIGKEHCAKFDLDPETVEEIWDEYHGKAHMAKSSLSQSLAKVTVNLLQSVGLKSK